MTSAAVSRDAREGPLPGDVDLSDPKTFRDLSKPVGALTEDRLAKFR